MQKINLSMRDTGEIHDKEDMMERKQEFTLENRRDGGRETAGQEGHGCGQQEFGNGLHRARWRLYPRGSHDVPPPGLGAKRTCSFDLNFAVHLGLFSSISTPFTLSIMSRSLKY